MEHIQETYGPSSPLSKTSPKRKAEDDPDVALVVAKKLHVEAPLYHYFIAADEGAFTAHRFALASTPKSAMILQVLGKLKGRALAAALDFITNSLTEKDVLESVEWFDKLPPAIRALSPAERGVWKEVGLVGRTQTCPTTYYSTYGEAPPAVNITHGRKSPALVKGDVYY